MGWLFGNSTNTSAGKRARTNFKASGANFLGLPRSVGKGSARHLRVGHVASSHQGAAYVPVANPMPLCDRITLAMDSRGLDPLEVGIELGIYEKELAKALAKEALMLAMGIEDMDFDPVEEAEEKTIEIIEEYMDGSKWIPRDMLYQWFDIIKEA